MSDSLRELYQQVILDHNKSPRNFHVLSDANRQADGHNLLCGDQFKVYLKVEDGKVQDIGIQGAGCAISKASASMMSAAVKGRPLEEVDELFHKFHGLVTGSGADDDPALGKLAVFAGVRDYPVRVKCATLSWHTLRAALSEGGVVSTE